MLFYEMMTRYCTRILNTAFKLLLCGVAFQIAMRCSGVKGQSDKIYQEVDGLVAIEAEHFSAQRFDKIRQWKLINSENPSSDTVQNILEAASGNAYMQILPDTRVTHDDKLIVGENFSNTPGEMAVLDYQVYFNTPGRYYVWVRCFSIGSEENGVHVGIDGTWPESGKRMQWCEGKNSWRWESSQRTEEVHCGVPGLIYLDVPASGVHTISFSMREDGFRMDKWLMINYRPKGEGPPENVYTGN